MSFDYYQILQVNATATHAEIKASYRKLAKIFHPDKNPGSEERFRIIKEAYETLIDDVKRNRYDIKRNYEISINQVKKPEPVKKQKIYTFTEPELKHRSYYQEHYKPKTTSYVKQTKSSKTNYKELTYLLISIPAAIALVLLLFNLYQKPGKKTTKIQSTKQIIVSEIKTAENPYKDFFEKEVYDTTSLPYIKIKNPGDNDVVVFLRNDKAKVVRHYFIEHNYQLYIEGIAKGNYTLFYYTGKGFTYKQSVLKNIMGDFSDAISIDSFSERIKIKPVKNDSFLFSIPKIENKKLDTVLLKQIFTTK